MSDEIYKNQIDYENLPADAIILDVRNGTEYSEVSLRRKHYFIELPNFNAEEFVKEYNLKGEPIYILCRSGVRSSKAAQEMEKIGYKNVYIIRGGILSVADNPKIVHKSAVMSMERQVRIVAGSLVLIGAILALFLNTAFALLPAFVGCGLIYAGISNTCAMASLLAKLPWNR